jgi:hypothetical protein
MTRALDPLLETISQGQEVNLHIVDIENLAGTGKLSTPKVKEICEDYEDGTQAGWNDVFILAAGPQNKQALFDGWTVGRPIFQFRKGKDGADEALASLFFQIEHPENFKRVFLASGDGGLAPIANSARESGIEVTVVTCEGGLSREFSKHKVLPLRRGH